MDNIKEIIIPFEYLKIPTVLYKYRDWSDKYHKKLILELSIYLSAPSDFEDPLDCKNPIRYDLLTDKEILDIYFNQSKNKNPEFSYHQHFQWAWNWFLNSPLRDPIQRNEIETNAAIEFNERFGVFSLTADPLNVSMWNKYSNQKKGFCVGYNSKLLFDFLGGGGEVIYCDNLPILKPFEEFVIQRHKQIFFKETKWNFEKEYRTHKFWPTRVTKIERNILIPKECLNEVIFGPEIENNHRIEIEEFVNVNLPHVNMKNTKIENGEIIYCN